jgi:hypothetical protein
MTRYRERGDSTTQIDTCMPKQDHFRNMEREREQDDTVAPFFASWNVL